MKKNIFGKVIFVLIFWFSIRKNRIVPKAFMYNLSKYYDKKHIYWLLLSTPISTRYTTLTLSSTDLIVDANPDLV